jgi:hypothetical protein
MPTAESSCATSSCDGCLVHAELAALAHKNELAAHLYEKAATQTERSGFAAYQAVANECAGRFHLRQERSALAQVYLMRARDAYC